MNKYNLTLEFLEKEHFVNNKPLRIIAQENNISEGSIFYLAKKLGLKNRTREESNKLFFIKNIDKEVLYKYYITENKSIKEIGEILKVCPVTIWKRLKEFHISIKPNGWKEVWNKGLDKNDPRVIAKAKKQSKTLKKRIANDSKLRQTYKEALEKGNKFLIRKKNKFESKIEKLLPIDYKYVGDGKFWIEGFNPDFINVNGCKKIVEAYGDYWHNLPNYKIRDEKRLKMYKKYGYDTLVIWQHELNNLDTLKQKVSRFIRS